MKTTSATRILLTLGAITTSALTSAQAEAGRFYLQGDVGAAITSDVELNEFFGPVAADSQINLNPGVRLGVRGGYGVTDWFAAEVETGFTINSIDSITGGSTDDASLTQVPFLVNARFECPACERFTPYFGGGVGFSSTILYGDRIQVGSSPQLDGSVGGLAFAYQAFVGVRYRLNERMGISLEYHFFGTESSDLELDGTVLGTVPSDEVHLGSTATHAITAAFDYRF